MKKNSLKAFVDSIRRMPRMALYLWLALLAVAARLSVFVRRRAFDDYAAVDGAAAAEIVLVMIAAGLVVQSQRLTPVLARGRRAGISLFAAAIGMGVLSCLWSPLPAFSAYRAFSVLSQLLAVMVALSFEPDFFRAEQRVLQVTGAVLIFQMIQVGGLIGFLSYRQNNTLSNSAAMAACYCLAELLSPGLDPRRKRLLKIVGFSAFSIIMIGTSSGSRVAFLAGMLCAVLLLRRPGLLAALAAVALCGWLFSVQVEDFQSVLFPNKTKAEIVSGHGRVGLWTMYLARLTDHFWIGEGYAATSRVAAVYSTNTHNSFISVLLGTGVIGTTIYLISLLKLFFYTAGAAARRWPGSVGVTAGLAAGLVNSMTKAFLGEGYCAETLVFFALFGLAALHVGRAPVKPRIQAARRAVRT